MGVARPPRVGAVGPAGRVSPLLQTPPPRSPPPRGVCGGGGRHATCPVHAAAGRGLAPCPVAVVPRPCARAAAPPPASPVWRGAGQVGTPWAPVGLSSLAPRARACAAGAAAGRPVVRPTLPTLSESDLVVSAGRPEAPSGDVPCQGGGLSPPLETRTTLSGGSLGSCVDEERS